MKPTVTVLMTVFNGGAYLSKAIESVLKQTYKDFEFLIINDASTDNSLAILKSYNDLRIMIIVHQTNCGQVASLNEGLREAQGEFVARMDADDEVSPQWLKCLVPFITTQPRCVVVSAGAYATTSKGFPLRKLRTPRTYEGILLKSLVASPINHVGSLMRRNIIINEGGYWSAFKIAADYDLWSRLLRQGYRIETYPKTLISVRFHRKSLSASEKDKLLVLEMAKVIRDNVLHYTLFPLCEDSAMLLRHYVHAPYAMSAEGYNEAARLMVEVCESFKKEICVNQIDVRSFLSQLQTAAAGKRALGRLMSNFFHA